MPDLKEDRAAIAPLHQFSAAKPTQSASNKWRNPPVDIQVPSNQMRNPWAGDRMKNTLHIGNRTAQATVLNQKRSSVPRSRPSEGKMKPKQPDVIIAPEEPIVIEDDSEDIGQRLSSPDRLDLFRGNKEPVAGPSFSNRTDAVLARGEIESDQIQDAPLVETRHIDFREIANAAGPAKKPELKTQPLPFQRQTLPAKQQKKTAAMKGKAGTTTPRVPPVKNPNPFTQTTAYSRSKGSNKLGPAHNLKIKQWCLGPKMFNSPYTLVWMNTKNKPKIILQSASMQPPTVTLSLDEMQCIEYTDHVAEHEMSIQLILGEPLPNSVTSIPEKFYDLSLLTKSHGVFSIVLCPLPLAHWELLLQHFREVVNNVYRIHGKNASHVIWEMAEAAQEPSIQTTPPPAGPSARPRIDRKRKASPTFEEVPSKHSRSGSPPIVIDQDVVTSRPDVVDQDTPATRRTTRQAYSKQKTAIPREDLDEVILVYPIGSPGAVPITNADLNRLAPGEFLNDTLIEFGLKLWLRDLQEQNPSLANDIHMFNSFFYKKLSKKNLHDGYLNVKRWTAKVDLFEKKIVIVPINENFHWYLAIIYMPEHMLQAPEETWSPNTRGKARSSATVPSLTDTPTTTPTPIQTKSKSPSADDDSVSGKTPPSSEAQVADELLMIEAKCNTGANATDAMVPSPLSSPPPSPMHVDDDDELRSDIVDPVTSQMELADLADDTETIGSDSGEVRGNQSEHTETHSALPNTFYGKSKRKWKARNGTSPPHPVESDVMQADETHAKVTEIVTEKEMSQSDGRPQTYIFILDSLGSRHPKATSTLSQYLQLEAKERRGLDNTSKAIGKSASVPPQPNFCDCGIYLLHYAKVFAANHAWLSQLIINPPKRTSQRDERHQIWQVDELTGFRESLADRVQDLSKEYKQVKEQDKKKQDTESNTALTEVESSDSEISIVDTTPAPDQKKKGKRSAKTSLPTESTATRLR